jgi:hypothetical protein
MQIRRLRHSARRWRCRRRRYPADPTSFARRAAAIVTLSRLAGEAARPEPVGLADGYGEVVECEVPCAGGAPLGAVGMTLTLRVGDLGGGSGCSSRSVVPLLDPVEYDAFFVGEGGPRIDACSFGEVVGIPTPSVRWLPAIPVGTLFCWCSPSLGPSRESRLANIDETLTRGSGLTNSRRRGPVAIVVDVTTVLTYGERWLTSGCVPPHLGG